jgi:hypothetical protein
MMAALAVGSNPDEHNSQIVTGLHHLAVFAPGDVLFVIIAHAAVDMGISTTAIEGLPLPLATGGRGAAFPPGRPRGPGPPLQALGMLQVLVKVLSAPK